MEWSDIATQYVWEVISIFDWIWRKLIGSAELRALAWRQEDDKRLASDTSVSARLPFFGNEGKSAWSPAPAGSPDAAVCLIATKPEINFTLANK